MPKITITPEDVLRSKLLIPGWYRCKVKDAIEETSKKGDSTNYVVDMNVIKGAKQKDGSDPAGVPLRRYYSEKAPGFSIPFFAAFGITFDGKTSKELDFAAAKDKEVDVYVINQMDDKQVMRNQAEDFAPAGTRSN